MKITSATISLPGISVSFEKDDGSNFSVDFTLNYIQNVMLCSLEKSIAVADIQPMLRLVREEILTIDTVKKPIADNELSFDVFIKTPDKLHRIGLSDLDSEPSVIEKEDSDTVNMFAIKVTELKNNFSSTTHFIINEVSAEQKQQETFLQEIEDLHVGFNPEKHADRETHLQNLATALQGEDEDKIKSMLNELSHYPDFIKAWAPCLEEAEDRTDLFNKILNANKHCFVIRTQDQKLIGLIMLTSTANDDLHYLGNFVVAKEYRHRLASIPLLSSMANILGQTVNDFIATFLTDNSALLAIMKTLGVNETATCPVAIGGQAMNDIPMLSAKAFREQSFGNSQFGIMPAPKNESVVVDSKTNTLEFTS